MAILALAVASAASSLRAQSVAGVVVGADGKPLGGVLVTAHDTASVERARTITTGSGVFRLAAPAGPFRLSVARIGFRRWFSPEYRAQGGDTLHVRLDVEEVPYQLPDLVATAPSRCRAEPGDRAAVLWEEARTALSAATATLDAAPIWYQVHQASRRLDAYERLKADTVRAMGLAARWPVEALPPDELFTRGFVQRRSGPDDLAWYGPDLDVLFDPRFLEQHCLRAIQGPEGSGLTGVAFAPAQQRNISDIRGALWFDAASRRLTAIEFFHTRLPRWVPAGTAGGRLEFAPISDGRWLIVRWRMRAPVPRRTMRGTALDGFAEFDGSVVTALGPARDTLWRGPSLLQLRATYTTGPDSTARAASPVSALVRSGPEGSRVVVLRNVSDREARVRAVRLEGCVNLLERCARYDVDLALAPGEERAALALHPWLQGRHWEVAAQAELAQGRGDAAPEPRRR